jgi:hypothetical protein
MESTFMERKTSGGVKNTSAPGQYPPVLLPQPPHWLKPHYDKGLVLSGTHTPHEYQSLVYAHTNDPSHRCSNPNPNRPVAFDEMMAADIVPELMYF